MRLVLDPTIRIFKPRYTAAVTTMVVQPVTAPGNAPENPGIKTPNHRGVAPSGPNAAEVEMEKYGRLSQSVSTTKSLRQYNRMITPQLLNFSLDA